MSRLAARRQADELSEQSEGPEFLVVRRSRRVQVLPRRRDRRRPESRRLHDSGAELDCGRDVPDGARPEVPHPRDPHRASGRRCSTPGSTRSSSSSRLDLHASQSLTGRVDSVRWFMKSRPQMERALRQLAFPLLLLVTVVATAYAAGATRPTAHKKAQAEVNVLRAVVRLSKARRIRALVDPRTHLLVN